MIFIFHGLVLVLLLCRSLLVVDGDDSDMSCRLIEVDAGSGGNGGALTCRGNLGSLLRGIQGEVVYEGIAGIDCGRICVKQFSKE